MSASLNPRQLPKRVAAVTQQLLQLVKQYAKPQKHYIEALSKHIEGFLGGTDAKDFFAFTGNNTSAHLPPITDITVQFSKKDKDMPAGFELVMGFNGQVADINKGNSRSLYLSFSRSKVDVGPASPVISPPAVPDVGDKPSDNKSRKPLTSIAVIYMSNHEEPPFGFELLESTSRGIKANLNTGTAGNCILMYSTWRWRADI